jgi:low temperature requirement protein LtrA
VASPVSDGEEERIRGVDPVRRSARTGPDTLLGAWTQTLFFTAALLVDWGGIYLTSRHGNWRLHSVAHLTERHGLFIILAIGESVVAIGVGAAQKPISAPLLLAAEHRLLEVHGQARVRLALEAYTYGHLPIVAGIVLAALGVEGVLAHAEEIKPLGAFYAAALFGGVALYLAGHLLFKQRMHTTLSLPRLVASGCSWRRCRPRSSSRRWPGWPVWCSSWPSW